MSTVEVKPPFAQFNGLDGLPLESGYLYIGTENLDPVTNPISVYWDYALSITATQPIRLINGYPSNNGTAGEIFTASKYSIKTKDANGSVAFYSLSEFGLSTDTTLRAELAASSGSSLVGFIQSGTGAVARTAQSKLREVVTIKDTGAIGDGATDDTTAVLAANLLNGPLSLTGNTHLFNISSYIGGGFPSHSADNVKISDGQIKVKTGTYGVSAAGVIDYYGMWSFTGNNGLAFNLNFDGNSQATYTAYNPSGSNVWMIPIVLTSSGKSGQKAVANSIISNGGHAIEGTNGNRMVIALNTANQHNGIGTTSTTSSAVIGNVSENTSDSHYFLNSTTNVSVTGNVGTTNVNGGGIDMAGVINGAVSSNVITGSKANAVWPLKSPNTGTLYNRLLISGNLVYNNCNYPNNEQGEIQIGDYNNLATTQGNDVAVIGNYIAQQDTPGGSGYNRAVWIHAKTTNTAVIGNAIFPDPALIAAAQPILQDKGSTFPIISGNVCFSTVPGTVYWDAAPVSQAHYTNNVNMRISPISVGIPSCMESSDGVWVYHIVRKLTKAGKVVLDIFYPSAYCHDKIELMVSNANDNGFLEHLIITRGATGSAVTVLANAVVTTLGTHPPTVTLNTAVNGRLRISAATAAAGFDNEDCGFFIRVISSSDSPSRFVPIFA
jgi:hypothetical protein